MPKVELHGSQGTRTLNVKPAPKRSENPEDVLYPLTLQEVIKTMPRRWYNIDELVYQLNVVHGIKANHRSVADAVKYCELEVRGIGIQMKVRRHDDKTCEHNRSACFAAEKELLPHLKKEGIDRDTLWDWIKKQYSVESRTQLDPYQWASISAEFNAALRDRRMLYFFIQRIKRKNK